MSDTVIIGVGNRYRGDDGVGWMVINVLQSKLNEKIPLIKVRGEITELIDIFTKYQNIFLVDACSLGEEIGSWRRIDALSEELPEDSTQTSTHGLGVSQAIALAKNLNIQPRKLIIYAISGKDFSMNEILTPQVEACVSKVAKELLKEEEIVSCMNFI